MRGRIIVATDLDGTLLGDPCALQRFADWLKARRSSLTLVYATGRTVESVRRLVLQGGLPVADFLIGSVGTELAETVSGEHDDSWESCAGRQFDAATVRRIASAIPGLEHQPDEFQSESKASFYLVDVEGRQRETLAAALSAAGVAAELVYSGNRFLDVLPRGMNKGTALRFLARKLGVERSRVIACGDSGNDLPMYLQGFRGVLVANAELQLVRLAAEPLYFSPFAFAEGVLDGVRHWIRSDRGLPERRDRLSPLRRW